MIIKKKIIYSLIDNNINILQKEMLEWINNNYPDWQDYNAYWEPSNKLQQ